MKRTKLHNSFNATNQIIINIFDATKNINKVHKNNAFHAIKNLHNFTRHNPFNTTKKSTNIN